MKYFTPDLIEQLNSSDHERRTAADAEWDRRLENYEQHLQRLEPLLPEPIREFNSLLLHDARVYSIARQGDQLYMVLRKDIPPRDLVIIAYRLVEEPAIDREAMTAEDRSSVMDYLYNEFDLMSAAGGQLYAESILFSNGWEIRLRFSDVRITLAEPIYPVPGIMLVPAPTALVPEST